MIDEIRNLLGGGQLNKKNFKIMVKMTNLVFNKRRKHKMFVCLQKYKFFVFKKILRKTFLLLFLIEKCFL